MSAYKPLGAMIAGWVAVLCLLSGCTTLGLPFGLSPEQETGWTHAKALFASMRAAYQPDRAFLRVAECRGAFACHRLDAITVSRPALESPHLEALLAHEFAHLLLSHHSPNYKQELDANAKAVEILQRVKGLSEPEALGMLHTYLYAAHLGRSSAAGHLTPCQEIEDLSRRFAAPALTCSSPLTAR